MPSWGRSTGILIGGRAARSNTALDFSRRRSSHASFMPTTPTTESSPARQSGSRACMCRRNTARFSSKVRDSEM